MGSQSSAPRDGRSNHDRVKSGKGKQVLAAKLENAEKTGSLSLAGINYKFGASIFDTLIEGSIPTKLKNLDLSGNDMKVIPSKAIILQKLQILQASRCNIQSTANLSSLPRLRKCILDHNDLEAATLGMLPVSIQLLDLSFNHFTEIPTHLSSVYINLTELDLSSNRLTSSHGLGQLLNLLHLKLDDNLLVEISDDIGELTKLQILSVKNNRLSKSAQSRSAQSIPEIVFTKTQVIKIDLGGNEDLARSDVLSFDGVDTFLERRAKVQDKNLHGGAILDLGVFGI